LPKQRLFWQIFFALMFLISKYLRVSFIYRGAMFADHVQ
jgi:hypothetical protein